MKAASTLPMLLVLGLLTSPAAADGQTKTYLKGLDAVKVNVSISQVLVDAGMPGKQLRTQTELQLRQAGLKVDPNLVGPNLYVEITGCKGPGTNTYACYIHVGVNDNVKVMRNEQAIVTQVWGPDLWVFYLPNGVADTLLQTTKLRVDEFVNDWLAANPR